MHLKKYCNRKKKEKYFQKSLAISEKWCYTTNIDTVNGMSGQKSTHCFCVDIRISTR